MRQKRLIIADAGYYHCVNRVRGQNALFADDAAKRKLKRLIDRVSAFSGVEIKTFALMDDHFHLLVKVPQKRDVGDEELDTRMRSLYGDEKTNTLLASWELWAAKGEQVKVDAAKAALRKRMFNLSDFFKTLKERYSKDFNRNHDCSGTFWSERFKSILLEPGSVILTTLGTYIDLNPVRAGKTEKPEDYEYCGIGAAVRGDKSAREGIREIVSPSPALSDKRIEFDDALKIYKQVMEGENPVNAFASVKRKFVPGTNLKTETTEQVQNAAKLREKRREFIEGAVLGTLGFIAKFVLDIMVTASHLGRYSYKPWSDKSYAEFYHACRINRINRRP